MGSEPERSSCLRSNGYFDLSIPYRSAIFVFGSHMPIQWLCSDGGWAEKAATAVRAKKAVAVAAVVRAALLSSPNRQRLQQLVTWFVPHTPLHPTRCLCLRLLPSFLQNRERPAALCSPTPPAEPLAPAGSHARTTRLDATGSTVRPIRRQSPGITLTFS
uniref:Uncharacterized protein n=1 Tax=Oryza rufipogon TaxID=4529 RepID=A0A0E0PB12_ORYRU